MRTAAGEGHHVDGEGPRPQTPDPEPLTAVRAPEATQEKGNRCRDREDTPEEGLMNSKSERKERQAAAKKTRHQPQHFPSRSHMRSPAAIPYTTIGTPGGSRR
jgi:hypothetical protein